MLFITVYNSHTYKNVGPFFQSVSQIWPNVKKKLRPLVYETSTLTPVAPDSYAVYFNSLHLTDHLIVKIHMHEV